MKSALIRVNYLIWEVFYNDVRESSCRWIRSSIGSGGVLSDMGFVGGGSAPGISLCDFRGIWRTRLTAVDFCRGVATGAGDFSDVSRIAMSFGFFQVR